MCVSERPRSAVGKGLGSGVGLPGAKSQLYTHQPCVWDKLTSFSFTFLSWKVLGIMVAASRIVFEAKMSYYIHSTSGPLLVQRKHHVNISCCCYYYYSVIHFFFLSARWVPPSKVYVCNVSQHTIWKILIRWWKFSKFAKGWGGGAWRHWGGSVASPKGLVIEFGPMLKTMGNHSRDGLKTFIFFLEN